MIKITQINNKISIEGHSVPQICAAISSIVYTTVNAIIKHVEIGNEGGQCTFEDNLEDDFFSIIIDKNDNFIDLMIENMFDMFYDVQEQDVNKSVQVVRFINNKRDD